MDIKSLITAAESNPDAVKLMMTFFKTYFEEHKEESLKLFKAIYTAIYGECFTPMLADEAVKGMENVDGTRGGHWTVEQSIQLAQKAGIDFNREHFNSYDWYYVLNMAYSDLKPLFGDNTDYYVNYTKLWLTDKDVPPGKAFRYYVSVVKNM